MLLLDLFDLYSARKLLSATSTTRVKYHVSIGHLESTIGRPARIDDLTDDTIAMTMSRLIRAGKTPQTVNGYRAKLLSLWRFALNRGMVRFGPEIGKIVEPLRSPVAWSVDELRRLFAACETQTGWVGPVRAPQFWRTLHLVMWDTGERITALMSARWEDWRPEERWLTIRAESRKGKRRDATYRLHAQTAEQIERMRPPERDLIFEWPNCRATMWYQYKRLLKAAGLPYDRRHMFHCMRRSVASHAERAGGDATALLGHSSRAITLESYISPTIAPRPQASDILFRPDGG